MRIRVPVGSQVLVGVLGAIVDDTAFAVTHHAAIAFHLAVR